MRNELIDWDGKAENVSMSYEVLLPQTKLLPGEIGVGKSNGSSTIHPEGELTEEEWNTSLSKADRTDYAMAVCCGVFSGIIDSFFIGEFSLERANDWGDEKVGNFVKAVANRERKKEGKSEFSNLKDAILHLEKEHGMAADEATNKFGGGYYHHFRDFSHHMSPVGLACSLYTQFSEGKAIGTDVYGTIIVVDVSKSKLLGKNFEEKITFGIIEWFLHLVSDMAGSSNNPGNGTGIPGPLVSMLKELSSLPIFKESKSAFERKDNEPLGFRTWISKLFTGTLLGKRDENGKILNKEKFDLRSEIGLLHEAGRQLIPVIINECLVRSAYFIRRLYLELKDTEIHSLSDLNNIEGAKLLPFNNPVIRRMVTISSGTLVAVDASDAFIRSLAKNRSVKNSKFWIDFAVRINIAGIGRFSVACVVDIRTSVRETRWKKLRGEHLEKEYGKELASIASFSLSFPQYQILCSLEKLMIDYDIKSTRKEVEVLSKKKWRDAWVKETLVPLPLMDGRQEQFFLNAKQMFDAIDLELKDTSESDWLHLLFSEAVLFKPYVEKIVEDEKWKKKGSFKNNYLPEIFVPQVSAIDPNEQKEIEKTCDKYEAKLTGSTRKRVFGIVGTSVVIVATGGAAAYFAPAIAPALAGTLFGETIAGLSGAALTSASLAAFGGGAIAAGGFGMAGGTAVIAGGGALLGLAGGTGASALASVQVLSSEAYVLDECTKLLAYCDVSLIGRLHQPLKVVAIYEQFKLKINDLKDSINDLSQQEHEEKEEEEKKRYAKLIKAAKESIKYMTKTCNLLKQMAENEKPNKQCKQLSAQSLLIPKEFELIQKKLPDEMGIPDKALAFSKRTENTSALIVKFPVSEEASMPFNNDSAIISELHEVLGDDAGIIKVSSGTTAAGRPYAYDIIKHGMTSEDNIPLGIEYTLNINVKTDECIMFINASFAEEGNTGMRDSVVLPMFMQANNRENFDDLDGWFRDPYDPEFKRGLLMNVSEMEELDEKFPWHALSEARSFAKFVIENN